MNGTQAAGPSDLDLKIKEAETCYAMGMFEESLILYEHVIASGKSIPPQARQTLSEKVGRLKKEILERQASERKGLSPEDISIFRKTMSKQKDIPTLLDGAAALKELGLMEEAVAEYEKLLALDHAACDYSKSDYAPGKIIVDYLTCLLEVEDPSEVVKKAYKIIYQQNLDEKAAAGVKSWLGQQMERRDLHDLAFELYKTAAEMNPADEIGRAHV
jgi:tetratricopeptide (TPR) repeat protein